MSQYIETTRMLKRLLDLVEREETPPVADASFADIELAGKDDEPERLGELIQFLEGAHEVEAFARTEPKRGPAQVLSFDSFQKRTPPTPQLEILDHVEFGRIVAQWAVDAASRPSTVEQLAEQVRGVAIVPEGLRRVAFAQEDGDTVLFNLPSANALQHALEAAGDPQARQPAPIPQFYADQLQPELAPMLTPTDALMARLGDRTMSLSR